MCGLSGVISSPTKRSTDELEYIRRLFTRLLVNSEHRGPYATGAAMMTRYGGYSVVKEPVMASEFIESIKYRRWLDGIDGDTSILMGHTRYPTRGSHLDNKNNQPLTSTVPIVKDWDKPGYVLLTHNGHISNHALLFKTTGLKREAQVDSEILLRFAERNVCANGIDIHGLIDDLSMCRGRLSIVTVSTNRPDQVLLIKGNMPLEVWYHPKHKLLAYASEVQILAESIGDDYGWRHIEIPPWTMAVVNTKRLLPMRFYKIHCISDTACGETICR